MKKLSFFSFIAALFFLTSCDTTREITIGTDGSGTMITTVDMSQMLGIAKMSGQGKEMENDKAMDTTISFAAMADSLSGISADEKALLKKGSMDVVMNMDEDKFMTKINFPFQKTADLTSLDKLSTRMVQEGLKKQASAKGGAPQGMPDDAMPQGSMDDYFVTTYTDGVIERKLNKEKYATVGDDKGMQALKEVGDQGLPINNKIILNLPRPAKKAEGAGVTLSEDKKKVTINTSISDFFDDAVKLEYRVEY
ncbi:MAG: hypothetical protein EOO01_23175 [Chitinophagaceae bacterium]|nr:MAG: hypothetical protein EOO01_23175 [Chitinophagaceae bacterium]